MLEFDTRAAAIAHLTNAICKDALTHSALWLSGGSTPITLYEALGKRLDFSNLTIGLVDERWVPETDAGSNAAMIKRTLLGGLDRTERDAMLLPMYLNGHDMHKDATDTDAAYQEAFAKRSPIAILGMGGDGHTASWFPTLTNLGDIASANCPNWVVALDATGSNANATTARITLTGAALDYCPKAYLFITGNEKRDVYTNAAANLPIHTAANLLGDRLEVVWAN